MDDCIFCKIVKGEIPSHKIWESKTHMAFLSIFPAVKGYTVVASKKHLPSKVEDLSVDDFQALLLASKSVQQKLTKAFGVDRTALIAEGTGVDHAHCKLIPLHGTSPDNPWQGGEAHEPVTFEKYEGYISTKEGPQADNDELAKIAQLINEVNKND